MRERKFLPPTIEDRRFYLSYVKIRPFLPSDGGSVEAPTKVPDPVFKGVFSWDKICISVKINEAPTFIVLEVVFDGNFPNLRFKQVLLIQEQND